jgi:hypothetical protein
MDLVLKHRNKGGSFDTSTVRVTQVLDRHKTSVGDESQAVIKGLLWRAAFSIIPRNNDIGARMLSCFRQQS